ncbi:hypothetical protein KTD31_01440 [Burkholderia multivorans]|uniref:hypothetical protein n=1 Tax=Burkholderia multivorans TaxID=87883 RepID=UPI001C23C7AC|nr:hypothetical protein [Burkholderia multivorans]MBU9200065.1 hypothetical protein [Burkholderia multivorans]
MKNLALLATRNDLNPFTQALKARCEREGAVLVKMRNGDWVEVRYRPANPIECESESFHTADHARYWFMDGSSLTSNVFDMVEFDTGAEAKGAAPVYLTEPQLLKYGQHAAWAVGAPMGLAYCPKTADEARNFEPHRWVLEAIQSAFLDGQWFERGEASVRMNQYGVAPRRAQSAQ